MQVKVPPHSKESEMMVLGCMLTSINSLNIAADALDESDFYFTEHKIIFPILKTSFKKDKPADVHLVAEELKRQSKLNDAGGINYLVTLAQYAATSAFIEEYIDVLKEHKYRRDLLDIALDLQNKALSSDDCKKIILSTQERLKLIERHQGLKEKFNIKFLREFDQNFLLAEPPKKPMLLEYAKSIKIAPTTDKFMPVGFLPKGIVAMLVGAGGVGKTHLLAQLAIAVSTGTPWLDTFTTTEHCGKENKGNVFLGLGENQYDDIHRILYKASKKLRVHQPDILKEDLLVEASKRIAPFSFCGQQAAFIEDRKPSIYFRNLKMQLEDTAPEDGWSLIILDPISRLMGADAETDNAAATQFIALLEELTIDLPGNPTVLLAHHVSKSSINEEKQSQTAARGVSALTDGVRWQCNFAKDIPKEQNEVSNLATLKMTKSNFTQIIEEIKTKKDFDGFIEKHIPIADQKQKVNVSF